MDGFRISLILCSLLAMQSLLRGQDEGTAAPLGAQATGQRVLVLVDGQLMENPFLVRPDGYDVQVAGGRGAPLPDAERLPPGQGTHPLAALVAAFVEQGFDGTFEFAPVGEAVETLGYDEVLRRVSATAAAWNRLVRVPA